MGIPPNAWNNYETGDRRISLDAALTLSDELGVTLDWIYKGDGKAMPYELMIQIKQVEAKERRRWFTWGDTLAVIVGTRAFAAGEDDWREVNPAELTFDAAALSEARAREVWSATLERLGDPPM